MKKYLSRITTFLLVALSISTITLAAQQYTIYVNGNKLDGKVIVQDGTTYVPLRVVTEALGCNVDVKNGIINVSNTTNSIPSVILETPTTPTQSNPSKPITTPVEEQSSNNLTQQEMLDCFNQMVKKSSVGDGAYRGYDVTIINTSFPNNNEMLIEYKAENSAKIKTYKELFVFTDVESARVFANGGLLNGYCGFQVRTQSRDEVEKPKGKPVEMFIQDENGKWIMNPDY